MASSTHTIKRAIIAELTRSPDKSPKEIGRALGDEWAESPKYDRLKQTLRLLVKKRLLWNPAHGVYRVSANSVRTGIDLRTKTEDDIERFLRLCGGIARTGDIHDAVGERSSSDAERTYDYYRVTLALKNSPRFRQDFGRGRWNLSEEERSELPLMGCWASHAIELGWDGPWQQGGFASWQDKRAGFFETIGDAFAEARGSIPVARVVADPVIADALARMCDGAPGARADALAGLQSDITAHGLSKPYEVASAIEDRAPRELPLHLYALFEAGHVGLHLGAPAAFYTACAALFGVDAAKLSRGL